jgi:deoxyribose-phosphate aldolase
MFFLLYLEPNIKEKIEYEMNQDVQNIYYAIHVKFYASRIILGFLTRKKKYSLTRICFLKRDNFIKYSTKFGNKQVFSKC